MKRPLLANNTRGLFQKANFSLYRTQSQRIIYIHHYGAPSAFSRKRKFHLFHIFNSTNNFTHDTGKPFDNTNLKSSNGINQRFKIDIHRYTLQQYRFLINCCVGHTALLLALSSGNIKNSIV